MASKTPQEGPKSAPGGPQEGPRGLQEGPKRSPRGSPNTTHDPTSRHTTHRAQQAARFLERRARRGPKTTPTTTHDSTRATRSMDGAVLGMTGATRPKNRTPNTPNTAHDAPCTAHYRRRGSCKRGRGEDQEPHTKPYERHGARHRQQAAGFTEWQTPQGPKSTDQTQHNAHHRPRATSGKVLGMTGVTTPKNRTRNATRDSRHTTHPTLQAEWFLE